MTFMGRQPGQAPTAVYISTDHAAGLRHRPATPMKAAKPVAASMKLKIALSEVAERETMYPAVVRWSQSVKAAISRSMWASGRLRPANERSADPVANQAKPRLSNRTGHPNSTPHLTQLEPYPISSRNESDPSLLSCEGRLRERPQAAGGSALQLFNRLSSERDRSGYS
jgi:hypothetical protein